MVLNRINKSLVQKVEKSETEKKLISLSNQQLKEIIYE